MPRPVDMRTGSTNSLIDALETLELQPLPLAPPKSDLGNLSDSLKEWQNKGKPWKVSQKSQRT